MNASTLAVWACLWPCLSYSAGSALAFAARHWAWFRWLRPMSSAAIGAVADLIGGAAAGAAVWLA